MKINDVIISEADAPTATNAATLRTAQDFAAGNTTAPAGVAGQRKKVLAPSDPQVMARQKELIAAGAKIKADGRMGPATTQAEKDYGAMANAAKGGNAPANQSQIDAQNALNQQAVLQQKQNAAQAGAADAPDRFAGQAKTDAETGQNHLNAPTTIAPAPAAEAPPTTPPAPADDLARMTQLAGAGRPAGGYGNFTGNVPQDQAAQAASAPAPEAPAAPSTVAPVVKTGSGGTLTTRDGKPVTSRSDDEIAWSQSHPYQPYPGPGWQEKQKAQGEKNWNAIKGFFGGNKQTPAQQPPAPANQPAGQGGQPMKGPQQPGGYGQFAESDDLTAMLRIAGLK
jgi:hypothetical protein